MCLYFGGISWKYDGKHKGMSWSVILEENLSHYSHIRKQNKHGVTCGEKYLIGHRKTPLDCLKGFLRLCYLRFELFEILQPSFTWPSQQMWQLIFIQRLATYIFGRRKQ